MSTTQVLVLLRRRTRRRDGRRLPEIRFVSASKEAGREARALLRGTRQLILPGRRRIRPEVGASLGRDPPKLLTCT
jgi:hypothetical protein